MTKKVRTEELFDCKNKYVADIFKNSEYPWEILPKVKSCIDNIISNAPDEFEEIENGVFVGKDVKIYPNVTIEPPAVIGSGTQIRPGAFLRGYVFVGENCVIGNSTELKSCIILDNVQVPHYNYVGDSILGNHSHMGAGSVCSNLKSDGKAVVIHGEEEYETGLRKVGAILGDNADVGCGCVLNPGTIIGKDTSVYPLTAVRGVIPGGCIVKDMNNIVKRK